MTTYTINHNDQYNSLEIFFDGKPDEAVRSALKGLKFRWHRIKKCWYGFADEETVRAAIESNPLSEYGSTFKDGYMGGIAWEGNHSNEPLYGASLTKALRDAFKKCGIKGVTVRSHSYSGGQSVYITITPFAGDLLTLDEYVKASSLFDFQSFGYVRDPENDYREVLLQTAENGPKEEYDRLLRAVAKNYYDRVVEGNSINERYFDEEKIFTDQFKKRLLAIKRIVDSYNHDDSNSMVDYFDRGFYEHYKLKAC